MELNIKNLERKKELYATVLGQCFSPCGRYLACSSHLGCITLFDILSALSTEVKNEAICSYFSFYVQDSDPLLCLSSKQNYLIGGGGSGNLYVWKWSDLIMKIPQNVLILHAPSANAWDLGSFEVNSIVLLGESLNELKAYAAYGDGSIRVWDLVAAKQTMKLEDKHTDSILCLDVKSANQIVSGSEDGFVKVWDERLEKPAVCKMLPASDRKCCRNNIGKWIKCLSVIPKRDWIICGGGPRLSLWHVGYQDSTTVFDTDAICNDVTFHDGTVISGGNESFVRHWSLNGQQQASVPCTPSNVFSIDVNCTENFPKVLCIAGNCNKIDVCTNFNYKSFSFRLF